MAASSDVNRRTSASTRFNIDQMTHSANVQALGPKLITEKLSTCGKVIRPDGL